VLVVARLPHNQLARYAAYVVAEPAPANKRKHA
jgi:hypothetical protein